MGSADKDVNSELFSDSGSFDDGRSAMYDPRKVKYRTYFDRFGYAKDWFKRGILRQESVYVDQMGMTQHHFRGKHFKCRCAHVDDEYFDQPACCLWITPRPFYPQIDNVNSRCYVQMENYSKCHMNYYRAKGKPNCGEYMRALQNCVDCHKSEKGNYEGKWATLKKMGKIWDQMIIHERDNLDGKVWEMAKKDKHLPRPPSFAEVKAAQQQHAPSPSSTSENS